MIRKDVFAVVKRRSNKGQRPSYISRDAAIVASHSQFRFDHFHLANRKVDVNKERNAEEHERNEFQVVEKLRVVHVEHKLNLVSFLVMIARVQWKTTVESCVLK